MKYRRSIAVLVGMLLIFCHSSRSIAAQTVTYQYPGLSFERTEAYRMFRKAHPGIKLQSKQNLDMDNVLYIQQQMVNQGTDMDIYHTRTMDNSLKAILSKGYYVPLQQGPDILRFTEGMYPVVRQAVMQGNDIAQLPIGTYLPYLYLLNPELMGRIGLSREEFPSTFPELIRFAEEWPQRYGSAYPDIKPLYISVGDPLVEARNFAAPLMLRAYLYSMTASEQEVRFDTPLFRSLLKDIAPLTRRMDPSSQSDDVMFDTPQWGECLFYVIWNTSPFYTPRMELLPPLPLESGGAQVQPLVLNAAHMNPYSKSMDASLQWLSFLAKYPDPVLSRTLGTESTPIDNPNYKNMAPAVRTEADRYLLSPAELEQYQQRLVPYLYVCGRSAFEAPGFLTQAESLLAQYLDGALPEEMLIKQLDNTIRLVTTEGSI